MKAQLSDVLVVVVAFLAGEMLGCQWAPKSQGASGPQETPELQDQGLGLEVSISSFL